MEKIEGVAAGYVDHAAGGDGGFDVVVGGDGHVDLLHVEAEGAELPFGHAVEEAGGVLHACSGDEGDRSAFEIRFDAFELVADQPERGCQHQLAHDPLPLVVSLCFCGFAAAVCA